MIPHRNMSEIPAGTENFALTDLVRDIRSLMEETAQAEPEPRSGSDIGRLVRTYYKQAVNQKEIIAYSVDLSFLNNEDDQIFTVFSNESELTKFINETPQVYRPHHLDNRIFAVISKKTGPGLEETYRTPTYKELLQVKDILVKHPDNLLDQL